MSELKVRTEYIIHRMPKEYFFLKEIQDLFTEFSVENYNIGKEIHYYYFGKFIDDKENIETRVFSSDFKLEDDVKD